VKSVREQVSAEEWQARVDLAACYRLTAMYGMTEMVANHISCRVPGTTDPVPAQSLRDALRGNRRFSLIKVDVEGNTLFNASDYDVNVAGFVFTAPSHRPSRHGLCRAHPHAGRHGRLGDGMRLAAAGTDLDAISSHRLSDFEGIADNVDERERLVRDLGDNEAMILRNHGLLVVAVPCPRLQCAVPLERACQVQVIGVVLQHQADLPAAKHPRRHL